MAAKLFVKTDTSRQRLALRDACTEYGLPYSTARAYIRAGRLAAERLPNGRLYVTRAAVEGLFRHVIIPEGN
jgi:predicted site-specific integrase-resolvase